MKSKKLIYVACPFWDKDASVREDRVAAATRYTRYLLLKKWYVFCPIVYSSGLEGGEEWAGERYWLSFGLRMLSKCDTFHLLQLEGWDKSKGVKAEAALATELNLDFKYVRGRVWGTSIKL